MVSNEHIPFRRDLLLLFAAIGIFLCIGLGARPYLTPSEARYIELPRQMLATGDWLTPRINGVPYFEKPPLFYWMQAAVMALFGPEEFAGRIVTVLLSTLTCLLTYAMGRLLYGRLSGLLAASVLATSLMGYGLSRVATLDVPVSLFINACIACFLAAQHTESVSLKRTFYLLMYVASALAMMTKGLIGIVIPGMVIGAWIATGNRWHILKEAQLIKGSIIFLAITAPWHVLMARAHPDFLNFYFIHEHFTRFLTDEHKRTAPWWFFIAVTWVGLLPWVLSPHLLRGPVLMGQTPQQVRGDRLFLLLWIVLPLLFFSSSHSKLLPYIFPIFLPLCIVIGNKLALFWNNILPMKSLRIDAWLAIAVFTLLLLATQLLPVMPGKLGQKVSMVTSNISWVSLLPIFISLAWVAFCSVRAEAPRLILSLMGVGIVTGISSNYIAASLDTATIKPLASLLSEQLQPDDMVVAYGSYWQDLPVYLNRNVTVAGWTGELSFGFEHYPETHDWMIATDEFWQRCSASPHNVYVFIHDDTAQNLPAPEHCHLHIIGQYGKTLLMEKELP